MKLTFRSKFNHGFTIIMAIYTVLCEKIYKILRQKEPRRQEITNFSFKMFKIMRFLRPPECCKTIVELTSLTQRANACSPWTACSVFYWKYPFWVNLFQKLKIVILSWNLELELIRRCRISLLCSLFLFLTGNTFFGKIWSKK